MSGISVASPRRCPRVSNRYSAITEGPTIGPSVSSTRTGSGSGRIERKELVVALIGVALDELHRLAVFGEHETHVTGTCGQGMMMKNRHQAGGLQAPVLQTEQTLIRGIEPARGRNKAIRSQPETGAFMDLKSIIDALILGVVEGVTEFLPGVLDRASPPASASCSASRTPARPSRC